MVSEFRDSAVSWKARFLATRVKFSVDFKYVERSGIAESFWHAWQIELKDGSSSVKFFLARLPESDAFQLRSDTRLNHVDLTPEIFHDFPLIHQNLVMISSLHY